jgi:hypothetical protein
MLFKKGIPNFGDLLFRTLAIFYSELWRSFTPNFGIILPTKSTPNPSKKVRKTVWLRVQKPDRRNFFIIARSSIFECVAILDVLKDENIIGDKLFKFFMIRRMSFPE